MMCCGRTGLSGMRLGCRNQKGREWRYWEKKELGEVASLGIRMDWGRSCGMGVGVEVGVVGWGLRLCPYFLGLCFGRVVEGC